MSLASNMNHLTYFITFFAFCPKFFYKKSIFLLNFEINIVMTDEERL